MLTPPILYLDIAKNPDEELVQPRHINYPYRSYGSKKCSFNSHWYASYPWLEYSVELDAAFCFPCRMFSSSKADPAFISKGFCDWKHATGKTGILSTHKACVTHKSAAVAWEQFKLNKQRSSTIHQQVQRVNSQVIEANRQYIKTLAEIILFCAHEEIALRGHNESVNYLCPGEFLALLSLVARHDPVVKNCLDNLPNHAKYTSPDIQNDLLSIMGNSVLQKICLEVQEAQYYSLLVDETKDICKIEQISVMVRYSVGGSVYERFLGHIAARELNAQLLVGYITSFLQKVNLSL